MSEHDDDDDGSLKPLRAVWLSMRDEEPPAGGMAALMAAARDKAEQMKAKPTAWQRFLGAMRRPPVLALAGVAVLISGAIVLGNRGDSMRAPTEPAAPTLERAPAIEAPAGSAVETPAPVETHSDSGARKVEAPVAPPTKPQRPAKKYVAKPAPPAAPPPTERLQVREEDATEDAVTGGRATGAKVPATQPPVAPVAPTKLEKASEAAAARGDCADVKRNAQQLSKADRPAYDALVQRNAAVARCLRQ